MFDFDNNVGKRSGKSPEKCRKKCREKSREKCREKSREKVKKKVGKIAQKKVGEKVGKKKTEHVNIKIKHDLGTVLMGLHIKASIVYRIDFFVIWRRKCL